MTAVEHPVYETVAAGTVVRSKAPLRISFAGGGTDVSPYMETHGGMVLSATIDKYAYGTLAARPDDEVTIQSLDFDVIAECLLDDAGERGDGLDLVRAVIRELNHGRKRGLAFFLHSDAPPGSGLGSSSTMVVALIGLLRHWQRLELSDYEVADLAYRIERVDLGIPGGMQDQYAAAFGGFNFIEFGGGRPVVNPLRVDPDVVNELQYHLLLCYTGRTRLSARILESQIRSYERGEAKVLRAMAELKRLTLELKTALLHGRVDDFGALLHEAWLHKQQLAAGITNPAIDALYEAARRQGALGGKILGAGAGGYLLLYCPYDRKHLVAAELERLGGQIVSFAFEPRGLQTWQVRS